ncbi:hypothetical protein HMN09_01153400 [Mycena chlorophos]|uniref:Uncharacterized protein n=1 Tax=Mycena chlorophos TaxID=658473 RepID=A0A8H6VZV3_MYCCL|nr:hypothetical protein HMN09_01153400 [Mycena chlorophos]
MSVFDPPTVLELMRKSSLGIKVPEWKAAVEKRVESWLKPFKSDPKLARALPQLTRQFIFEAHVAQYVMAVWKATHIHGNSKSTTPKTLPKDVPIYGPRFLPSTLLDVSKRNPTCVEPETLYIRPLNVRSRGTSGSDLERGDVHGLFYEERALGYQLRCSECETKYKGKKVLGRDGEKLGYCFATTNAKAWAGINHWEIPRGIPYFTQRTAVTRELFDVIIELRPSTTSGKLAEEIKQLHLLEYHKRKHEYIQAHSTREVPSQFLDHSPLHAFSESFNMAGYADNTITDDFITDIYIEFTNRNARRRVRPVPSDARSLDNTFKSAIKATVVEAETYAHLKLMKGGILTVLNEMNQIISWKFCQSASVSEISELLEGIKKRLSFLGSTPRDVHS